LSTSARDLVELPDSREFVLGDVLGFEEAWIVGCTRISGNAREVTVGQQALGERTERDAADALVLKRWYFGW
jgi:hypothetical protein